MLKYIDSLKQDLIDEQNDLIKLLNYNSDYVMLKINGEEYNSGIPRIVIGRYKRYITDVESIAIYRDFYVYKIDMELDDLTDFRKLKSEIIILNTDSLYLEIDLDIKYLLNPNSNIINICNLTYPIKVSEIGLHNVPNKSKIIFYLQKRINNLDFKNNMLNLINISDSSYGRSSVQLYGNKFTKKFLLGFVIDSINSNFSKIQLCKRQYGKTEICTYNFNFDDLVNIEDNDGNSLYVLIFDPKYRNINSITDIFNNQLTITDFDTYYESIDKTFFELYINNIDAFSYYIRERDISARAIMII